MDHMGMSGINHKHKPIGSMYAIYGNMDPINIPPLYVSIYTSTMDPMGNTI